MRTNRKCPMYMEDDEGNQIHREGAIAEGLMERRGTKIKIKSKLLAKKKEGEESADVKANPPEPRAAASVHSNVVTAGLAGKQPEQPAVSGNSSHGAGSDEISSAALRLAQPNTFEQPPATGLAEAGGGDVALGGSRLKERKVSLSIKKEKRRDEGERDGRREIERDTKPSQDLEQAVEGGLSRKRPREDGKRERERERERESERDREREGRETKVKEKADGRAVEAVLRSHPSDKEKQVRPAKGVVEAGSERGGKEGRHERREVEGGEQADLMRVREGKATGNEGRVKERASGGGGAVGRVDMELMSRVKLKPVKIRLSTVKITRGTPSPPPPAAAAAVAATQGTHGAAGLSGFSKEEGEGGRGGERESVMGGSARFGRREEADGMEAGEQRRGRERLDKQYSDREKERMDAGVPNDKKKRRSDADDEEEEEDEEWEGSSSGGVKRIKMSEGVTLVGFYFSEVSEVLGHQS